jgi:FkbM family methyltransferase
MNEWFEWIIARMFALMHNIERDNFDSARYRDEPENAFDPIFHAAYFLFLDKYRADLYRARSLLFDDPSRDLFDQLILFRLLGHLHVRLAFNTPAIRNYEETIGKWRVNETEDSGLLGPLSIFVVPFEEAICMKCWSGNIAANVLFRQYYFERNGMRIAPSAGDHALDVGGCFGDTALFFARDVGDSGHVYTFDPMPKHCEIMRENVAMNPLLERRISIFPFGLSDANTSGAVARGGIDPGARMSDDLPGRTLDSLDIERVDFIKMDVEGSELAALKGGETTIRRCKPRLAISLYHRFEDFFTIPLWIDSLKLGYRLYLDHYSIHHEETVLYATTHH